MGFHFFCRKTNRIRLVFGLAVVASVGGAAASFGPRSFAQDTGSIDKWTDATGTKTIEATFVKLDGVTLTLKKSDGKEIPIPLSKLDDKSRIRARSLAKEMAAARVSASASTASTSDSSSLPSSADATPIVVFPSNPTAQQFFDVVQKEMEKENSIVLWDALPASKQQKIQEMVRLAAGKIEQRTMDQIKRFRSNLLSALQSKKSLVLNSKALPVPPNNRAMIEKMYDPVVAFVESAIPPELLETSNLKDKSLRDLLDKYFRETVVTSKALQSAMKDLPLPPEMKSAMGAKASFKVEQASDKEATVSVSLPQQPTTKLQFVPVEGKWFPKDALAGWDQAMTQMKSSIQSADPKQIHQGVGQAMFVANGALGAFSAAETQEDFDAAVQQVMGMMPGMSGTPGMGPPGMMPGGDSGDRSRPRKGPLGSN